ncbi:uncharacterized protein EURHEDRAFT_409894 [Aspergillus ruber CBS 135680]|uniref:Secreted protein n=1 Tax=Aspergillus ruber (strain CBS 135680) TaxID=1388766 RepID=A0A017SL15_ASPRC|nr:uncharacterized protein EURHEDRAFT_409894 [Aspergillus ruber CBS 135680]EYE97658.1 hypothetical protein EURHEDRAFT_409894 [Aspergillus ruber CBS 135680]
MINQTTTLFLVTTLVLAMDPCDFFLPVPDHGTLGSGSIRRTFYPFFRSLSLYPPYICIWSANTGCTQSTTLSTSSRFCSPRSLSPNPSAHRSNPPSQPAANSPHGSRHRAKHRAHRSGQHTDRTS